MIHQLRREQVVAGSPEAVWDFFATPRNLDRITPAAMAFHLVRGGDERMYAGQMIEYRIGLLPGVRTRWLTEITHVCPGDYFVDEQRIGPYRLWHHEHRFAPAPGGRGVTMTDCVTYAVGWGPLGEALHALWIRRRLAEIFDFRARAVAELFSSGAH